MQDDFFLEDQLGVAMATGTQTGGLAVSSSVPVAIPVHGEAALARRLFDIFVAASVLLCTLPILAVSCLLVRLTSAGPAIFKQTRVGKDGRHFPCYKVRTMVVDAERQKSALADQNLHSDARTFKMKADPRITAVGRWLRRFSIDELPQLWNVLRGDMSLVGPRPPVPSEVAQYSPWEMKRLSVRPGLTCLWQVRGRSELDFPEQVALDLEYIESRTMMLDLQLLVQTIPAVLGGRGAY